MYGFVFARHKRRALCALCQYLTANYSLLAAAGRPRAMSEPDPCSFSVQAVTLQDSCDQHESWETTKLLTNDQFFPARSLALQHRFSANHDGVLQTCRERPHGDSRPPHDFPCPSREVVWPCMASSSQRGSITGSTSCLHEPLTVAHNTPATAGSSRH